MGRSGGIAINEGVALLDRLSPGRLNELQSKYPVIADQLGLGINAGAEEQDESTRADDPYSNEKANIMITALNEARRAAEAALAALSRRVKNARRQRLISQSLVLIGSSSSLATLALSETRAAVIAAVLTLLAAMGNLLAEYQEKLLSPQAGNIYENFQKLAEGAYKAHSLSTELTLALKYRQDGKNLKGLIADANVLCEQLNGGLIQLLENVPAKTA